MFGNAKKTISENTFKHTHYFSYVELFFDKISKVDYLTENSLLFSNIYCTLMNTFAIYFLIMELRVFPTCFPLHVR